MARVFDITAATDAVRLDTKGHGDAAFTVSNVTGRRIRGRAKAVPKDPATAGWLKIAGDVERDFPSGGTQVFTASVAIPPEARSGTYSFRLDVVSVDNPDEETAQGPSVGFTVADVVPPPPKSYLAWFALAVIVLLVVGGGALWMVRPRHSAATPAPTPSPTPSPVAPASFAGDWTTNVARLVLTQEGANVRGEYRAYGSDAPLKVEGVVADRTLSGSFGDPAAPFAVVLDSGNDTFRGTWGAKKSWCGQRHFPSDLPADCGLTGAWTFKTGKLTLTVDLKQRGDDVTGTLSGDLVIQVPGSETVRKALHGDVSGHLRGWVLEGRMHAGVDDFRDLDKRIRWTLLNQDFQQFQGIESPFVQSGDQLIAIYLEDNCGARKGSPLPEPCREPSGLVLDSFTLNAPPGTDQWDQLDNAPTKVVQVVGGDFRATIAVKASTVNHVQVVAFGIRDPVRPNQWVRIAKGFSNDVNPHAVVSVQMRRQAPGPFKPPFPNAAMGTMVGRGGVFVTPQQPQARGPLEPPPTPRPTASVLPPLIPYTAEVVHFMIERRAALWTFSYSADGTEWTVVQPNMDFPPLRTVELYAVAYSNFNQLPLVAGFSNLKVTTP